MQLKLITVDQINFAIETRYIELNRGTVVHYRSAATGKFADNENDILRGLDKYIVAVVCNEGHGDIKISRHDGAYVISDAKTIEVVNTPSNFDNFQFWVKNSKYAAWEKIDLSYYVEYSKNDKNAVYCVYAEGVDPNNI